MSFVELRASALAPDVSPIRIHYREIGHGRPVVILSHSLGFAHGMWDALAQQLLPHVRVVRYDTRGHGDSEATPGDYTIEQLSRDALALADTLGIQTFAFCGLSLGGMIGQWLGAHAPDLSAEDIERIHRLWADAVRIVGPDVHHRDVVAAALGAFQDELDGDRHDAAVARLQERIGAH